MRLTHKIAAPFLSLLLLTSLWGCDLLGILSGGEPGGSDPIDFTPTVYTEVVKTAFERTYADQLSPNERAIYDAVTALPLASTSVDITLPEVPALCAGRSPTDAEMDALGADISSFAANALYAAWLDHPTLYWLDHSRYSYKLEVAGGDDGIVRLTKLTLELTLTATEEELQEEEAALAATLADFQPKGATPAERVAYINGYLTARITYDLDAPHRGSVIGALVYGKCVCEGYARAFDLLCEKAGLDAVCIPGYGKTEEGEEGHMWNGVFIDGVLYGVDTTWNDTTGQSVYLLVGENTVCHDLPFGESHLPNMLTKDDTHKPFALPKIAKDALNHVQNQR